MSPGEFSDSKALEQVCIQAKYAGYIERQVAEVDKRSRQTQTKIPLDFDYNLVKGLSNELLEKLMAARPHNIGQAEKIAGMTPAAISLILIFLKKHQTTTKA